MAAGTSPGFRNKILKAIFWGTSIAGVSDNAGTSPNTSIYVSGHTADPSGSDAQTASEISYTGYARVAVPRDNTGFAISGNTVKPVNTVAFPASTGGAGGTITHMGYGKASSGTGELWYSGPCTPNIVVASGVTPAATNNSTGTVT